ncbi:importin-alpha export receptor, partial [Coemansia sp. RSA 2320]
EQFLASIEQAPHFVVPLLQLVSNQSTDANVRFAAALYFKNYVKRRWPQDENSEDALLADDRQAVKSEIVSLMITVPKNLQLQIGEAVSIIAEHDFPTQWPELISDMVSKLSATDYHVNNGILQTAHTVFKEWRSAFRSDDLYTKINYVLGQFTEAYMQVFVATDKLIDEHAGNRAALQILLHSLMLLCQIYYDLNCQDLPPFFEDNMAEFMQTFHKYLVYTNPNVDSDGDNDTAGDLEEVKASICEIIELYAQRFEEEFKQLPQFVETVWSMLTTVGAGHKYDGVVSKGMAFLRTVVRNPRQRALFSSSESLKLICERIIIPNTVLPETDEELFEDDPIQFVRREVEGSVADSRREAAADLVRGLLDQFSAETTQVMSAYIQRGLEQYAANPAAHWRDKDVALFMVTSVAVVASVGSLGATQVNDLVNVSDFFSSHILQHLQD